MLVTAEAPVQEVISVPLPVQQAPQPVIQTNESPHIEQGPSQVQVSGQGQIQMQGQIQSQIQNQLQGQMQGQIQGQNQEQQVRQIIMPTISNQGGQIILHGETGSIFMST